MRCGKSRWWRLRVWPETANGTPLLTAAAIYLEDWLPKKEFDTRFDIRRTPSRISCDIGGRHTVV